MEPEELIGWFEEENNLTIVEMTYENEAGLGFRDESLPFFDKEGAYDFVTFKDLSGMALEDLKSNLFYGLKVNIITRITGYFSSSAGWNKGKLAELKDRDRESIVTFGAALKPEPVNPDAKV